MIGKVEITQRQFKKLAKFVYDEAGINLTSEKMQLLKARAAKRLRAKKIPTISEYIKVISKDKDEFVNFIDVITTNHTFFFRENTHCEYIIKNIDKNKSLKIWSAACSSGEEPYSIAVQLMDNSFNFAIYGSDISDTMIKFALRGIYPNERTQSVPFQIMHKYFQKGHNKWEGSVKVKNHVKNHVRFGKFNLISDAPFDKFDIIFCRNVMIYFDSRTKQNVVDRLCYSLKPGGYLFVGISESIQGLKHNLKHEMSSAYIKN